MAFLDNSGDIILDAVLTDLGRKRMAEGNFRITSFALGDDEIDYSLYDPTHPSGSAYYDLEILQTPVFEAFTQTNANINYGLLSLRDDLLYIPSLVHNQAGDTRAKKLYNNVLHVAVNNETQTALAEGTGSPITRDQIMLRTQTSDYVLFETGINNNGNPSGILANKTSYITNQNLNDNDFMAKVDTRFIQGLFPSLGTSKFNFDKSSSTSSGFEEQFGFTTSPVTPNASGDIVLPSINNGVVDTSDDDSALSYSSINGPRARALAFRMSINGELDKTKDAAAPTEYSLFGKTGQTLYGISSATFDFIDTVVYLNGSSTGANTQLIVRIIRRAS